MYLEPGRFSIRVRRNMKRWRVYNFQQKFLVNIKSYLRQRKGIKRKYISCYCANYNDRYNPKATADWDYTDLKINKV